MRVAGTILMWFGAFFVSVAAAAVLGPVLRGLGIDSRAETTSVIGTALIGAFSFMTGALIRRRSTDAIAARGIGDAQARQIGARMDETPHVRQRDEALERRGRDETR